MCFGAIGPKAVIIGPEANHPKGASVFNRTLLPEKALVKGGCKQACVGAIGSKAITTGPNANYPKGPSVFNRALLLKKALVRGGCEKCVSELSARRLLL